MTNDFEQDWAKTMKKIRQTNTVSQTDSVIQKKQLDEELKYFKQKLQQALKVRDEIEAKQNLKKLITVRARLLKLSLSEPRSDREEKIEAYYLDCYKLTKTVSKLLSK